MTLFMNRYLVVIGGESPIDDQEGDKQNQKEAAAKEAAENQLQIEEKVEKKADGSEDKASYCSEQDQKTKCLGDVWVYDINL